ncbi:hypothetical protein BU23DRAFT_633867 [Bimuria novae-zelandiae CBS 107.79]|uniref:Uncharacterized protein n=1 Tax=Bimuria novae-zelandiae CBS 107.79 TaxID=1447943 RepID=A0A6A5VFU1_9PLEO|nr:hypothetical protein BU23DRAFT_633867 [Bimuria novae-zelandiae CBS 107.79]
MTSGSNSPVSFRNINTPSRTGVVSSQSSTPASVSTLPIVAAKRPIKKLVSKIASKEATNSVDYMLGEINGPATPVGGKQPAQVSGTAKRNELNKKREEEKFRRDAEKGAFAKGKLKRSFNDTMAASRMSRSRAHDQASQSVTTMVKAPMILRANRAAQATPVGFEAPKTPKSFTDEKEEDEISQTRYMAVDKENSALKIIDVRKVKYIRTGANNTVVAKLENIVEAPEMYPNIQLTYDDKGVPLQARTTIFNEEQSQWASSLRK